MSDLPDYDVEAEAEAYAYELLHAATTVIASGDEALAAEFVEALDDDDRQFLSATRDIWMTAEPSDFVDADDYEDDEVDADSDYIDDDPERAAWYDAAIAELQKAHPAVPIRPDVFNQFVHAAGGDFDAAFKLYRDTYSEVGRRGQGPDLDDAIAVLHDEAYTKAAERKYGLPAIDADAFSDESPQHTSVNDAADAMFDDLYGGGDE